MVGNPTHGNLFVLWLGVFALVTAGQRQVQFLGCGFGILGEHFVKIAQSEKQNRIWVLFFNL